MSHFKGSDQIGIEKKWERHFFDSRTAIAIFMLAASLGLSISLLFLWPQYLFPAIFNSRLAKKLILISDDYLTCNKEYARFVIDEPPASVAMQSYYFFNVTNAAAVLQRGVRPIVHEVGPFSYQKMTYKYDMKFTGPNDESVVFKERSILKPVSDPSQCSAMYFRTGKADTLLDNPCKDGQCDCKDDSVSITAVNPLFLKLLWKDSSQRVVSRLSLKVFKKIRQVFEKDFVVAVQKYLVSSSHTEVYAFRTQMQVYIVLAAGIGNLLSNVSLTASKVSFMMDGTLLFPPSCGLEAFGFYSCASALGMKQQLSDQRNLMKKDFPSLKSSDFPSVAPLLDGSVPYSLLDSSLGLPQWIGLCGCLGFLKTSYTIVFESDCIMISSHLTMSLATAYFGSSPTSKQIAGSLAVVRGVASYLAGTLVKPHESLWKLLVREEFAKGSDTVTCTPLGHQCVWQWGYLVQHHRARSLTQNMIMSLIDESATASNLPNSIHYDGNGAKYYNTRTYCSVVRYPETPNSKSNPLACEGIDSSIIDDAMVKTPTWLWGVDHNVSYQNSSAASNGYARETTHAKNVYVDIGCNISALLYYVFTDSTSYHNQYVVAYLNKNKGAAFSHNFTVERMEEIGYAQWGAGVVTNAIFQVPTINQLKWDGMWRLADQKYVAMIMEFYGWALLAAYPQAAIYNVNESRALLTLLASDGDDGDDFRERIVYAGSTFVGNGVNFIRNVGAVGDLTYTTEANNANFSCDTLYTSVTKNSKSASFKDACKPLDYFFSSSSLTCQRVQNIFGSCRTQSYRSWWVTNCNKFETYLTSGLSGVPCDQFQVNGHMHPYKKSRGNIAYSMITTLTNALVLTNGLWCVGASGDSIACDYKQGGLFITAPVRNFLFEGVSDPSVLEYLNVKYRRHNISFNCATDALDVCGIPQYMCDPATGIVLNFPGGGHKLLQYNKTKKDEFFAPFFEITSEGDLLWRYAMDPAIAKSSKDRYIKMQSGNTSGNVTLTMVENPLWAAYPAWNHPSSEEFLKYYQCQQRTLFGSIGLFKSCEDQVNSGKSIIGSALNMEKMKGNATVRHFMGRSAQNHSTLQVFGSSTHFHQHQMFMYDGFKSYPYVYFKRQGGTDFYSRKAISLFDKLNAVRLDLDQSTLASPTETDLQLSYPLPSTWLGASANRSSKTIAGSGGTTSDSNKKGNGGAAATAPIRRFADSAATWDVLRKLGTPLDSFGMRYSIPIGMASIERLAGFPVYIGTVHNYGNALWGGVEYTQINGLSPSRLKHRTHADYDPVTGRALRQTLRLQYMFRAERSSILPSLASFGSTCPVPNKLYSGAAGYGCFTYLPLFWHEDARFQTESEFVDTYNHFYVKPMHAWVSATVGATLGSILFISGTIMVIYERYKRIKFMKRVYID